MDVSTIGLIEDEDILLDLASLALSHLDHDNADIAPYLEKLEEIEATFSNASSESSGGPNSSGILTRKVPRRAL